MIAWVCCLCAALSAQSSPRDLHARAVALEAQGNHSAALALLWEAAGLAPDDADIQNRLGEALDRLGALDAAIQAFHGALAARPAFQKAANNLILTLVKAGRGPEALDRARALAARDPRDPERLFTLALALSEQDLEEALAVFRRVLDLAPDHALARYNLALALKRADRLHEAAAELRRAIAIEPRPEAHYSLGVILWHQGDVDGALGALRAAIAAHPQYADAYYTLGAVLKARKELPPAAAALRRAIALRPDLWGAHYTLGQVLQLSGDARGARAQLDEAERRRLDAQAEREAGVWTSVGTGRLDAGDAAGAIECFERATAILDSYAPAHYQLGRALHRLGRLDAARSAFARAQQLNPSLVPPRDLQ